MALLPNMADQNINSRRQLKHGRWPQQSTCLVILDYYTSDVLEQHLTGRDVIVVTYKGYFFMFYAYPCKLIEGQPHL